MKWEIGLDSSEKKQYETREMHWAIWKTVFNAVSSNVIENMHL